MTHKQKKAVIYAPFWRQAGHVGNNRVDRFIRWLADDGYSVVLIRAGTTDAEQRETWGQEITVRDSLGLYRDTAPEAATAVSPRKPSKFRRALAYWLFNPDPTVVWARAAARHPMVLQAMEGVAFILSSSPPESAHVGAWMLSRRTGVPHIVDMRDGWLDEPLKPILQNSALRRWQEGRVEARILHDAKIIQVTSDVWRELLCERYPALAAKVRVLTNGYPQHTPVPLTRPTKGADDELVLIHAGRFTGSRLTQLPNLLLAPLLRDLSGKSVRGVVRLIGPLSADELGIIDSFRQRFMECGWRIECPGTMPRLELLKLLSTADGLLLLSASHAAIPSKLFEYIVTGRTIFAVTEKGSAVWRMCATLRQVCLLNIFNPDGDVDFINKILSHKEGNSSDIPDCFAEPYLKDIFKKSAEKF